MHHKIFIQQIVAIAGPPVTTAPQFLYRSLHINESPFPQTVQSSSDAGLRTAAGDGDGSYIYLAGVPVAGAEYQVTVHRQLMGREAVIENLGVKLKKLLIVISHCIPPLLSDRITEV